jgi:hypothetical protein
MALPHARNVVYSGATSKIRVGKSAIPLTKATPPKEAVKQEGVPVIGQMVVTDFTLGLYTCDGASIEMTSATFANKMLPKLPKHGWSGFEFVITIMERHPLVAGKYGAIWDRCTIIGNEAEAYEASEKGRKVVLPLRVVQVFHCGADGVYKSLALNPEEPTPTAAAFML